MKDALCTRDKRTKRMPQSSSIIQDTTQDQRKAATSPYLCAAWSEKGSRAHLRATSPRKNNSLRGEILCANQVHVIRKSSAEKRRVPVHKSSQNTTELARTARRDQSRAHATPERSDVHSESRIWQSTDAAPASQRERSYAEAG